MNEQLATAVATGSARAEAVLMRFGTDVLALLLGPRSLTINRAGTCCPRHRSASPADLLFAAGPS
jgi:hypothetical protein